MEEIKKSLDFIAGPTEVEEKEMSVYLIGKLGGSKELYSMLFEYAARHKDCSIMKGEVKSLIDIIEPLDRRKTPGDHVLGDLGIYAQDCDIIFPKGRRDLGVVVCGVRKLGKPGDDSPVLFQTAYFMKKTGDGLLYQEIITTESREVYLQTPFDVKVKPIETYEKDIRGVQIDKKEFEKQFKKHKKRYDGLTGEE
tara:strand:+ start:27 stop:611 length:585 start_codon:yes stop_codon:yes gene_type:complete